MPTVSVILLEDNAIDALKVQMMLNEKYGKYKFLLLGIFDTLPPMLEYLQHHEVDIVISDIFIKNRPVGLEVLQALLLRNIPIVLTTNSHDKSLFDASRQYREVYYLIKPFHALTLHSILEKIVEEQAKSKNHNFADRKYFYLSGMGGHREQVFFDEIIYLLSESNNCFIFTASKKYVVKKSLTKILNEDLGEGFLRIHQQYIINKLHLKKAGHDTLTLTGAISLPVGKSFRKGVMAFLKGG
ncbi:MAG: LytTR family transcriptional regulator DNA-binding domain-containing protein [Spirosomataceae bacterium]